MLCWRSKESYGAILAGAILYRHIVPLTLGPITKVTLGRPFWENESPLDSDTSLRSTRVRSQSPDREENHIRNGNLRPTRRVQYSSATILSVKPTWQTRCGRWAGKMQILKPSAAASATDQRDYAPCVCSRLAALYKVRECRDGGIGRRAGLRIQCRKACRFKSCSRHHRLRRRKQTTY